MQFGRLITAMATPFATDGSLDLDGAATLARHLTSHGTESIVVAGTTGESPTLTKEEKRDLFTAVVEACRGRAAVIAGTGTYSTAESIELSEMAAGCGVDGLLLVTPYYSRPPQAGLLRHFTAVAESVDLPIILYDIPSRTGRKIEHPTLVQLSDVPNIVGVKDAAGDPAGTSTLAAAAPGFTIWSGDDALTLPLLSVGAAGVISVASHLAGERIAECIAAYVKGDVEHAATVDHALRPLYEVLFITSNPIPLKAALAMMGLPAGPCRSPLVDASEDEKTRIRAVLAKLGIV
jgi:4-hydroxy-tetrahydrodipicolinate synthase